MKEPLSPADRAALSGGISGGNEYYEFAVRRLESRLPGSRILDLGCGTGGFGVYLAKRFGVRPQGADVIRHEGLAEAGYGGFQLADLDALDAQALPDGNDFVFALGLIEYLTNPRRFIRAATSLLKPGGHLVLTAPNPASLRSVVALARSGEFSAFKVATNPASITPVLAADAARMLGEAGLDEVQVTFSDQGGVPGAGELRWQRLFCFACGRWFSDDYRALGIR